jgi:hypothetical protein
MSNDGVVRIEEVLKGFIGLAALLASEFKNGINAETLVDVVIKIEANADLKNAIVKMYNDIDKIPSDVKDLSLPESISLLTVAVPELMQLVSAIKK